MKMARIVQLIGLLFWTPLIFASDVANNVTSNLIHNEPHKILVLGDSLSAGYGIDVNDGWVQLIQERLVSQPYHMINASVSGETSGGGLARLPALLKEYKPSIVILELGGNDGLRGHPINVMRQSLEKIIQLSSSADAQVLLLGMQIPPNYGARYTKTFQQTYAELAKHYQLTWVPFFLDGVAGNTDLMQRDGIHPTAEAQSILANNVWPVLESILTAKPEDSTSL